MVISPGGHAHIGWFEEAIGAILRRKSVPPFVSLGPIQIQSAPVWGSESPGSSTRLRKPSCSSTVANGDCAQNPSLSVMAIYHQVGIASTSGHTQCGDANS